MYDFLTRVILLQKFYSQMSTFANLQAFTEPCAHLKRICMQNRMNRKNEHTYAKLVLAHLVMVNDVPNFFSDFCSSLAFLQGPVAFTNLFGVYYPAVSLNCNVTVSVHTGLDLPSDSETSDSGTRC